MDIPLWGPAALLVIFILLSAFFSGTETALFSLPRLRLRKLLREDKRAGTVSHLLERPHYLLTAILVGNMTVNIFASACSSTIVRRMDVPVFTRPLFNMPEGFIGGLAAVVGTTALILVLGEVTPKTIALRNAERFSLLVARPIHLFCRSISWFIGFLVALADPVIRLLLRILDGGAQRSPAVTEDELKTMVGVVEEEGGLEEEERRMIDRILEFGDTVVKDVYVPRMDVVRLRSDSTLGDAVATVKEAGHRRIPVFEGTIDNVIGIVYIKDLLPYVRQKNLDLSVRELLRPAYFVPEAKKVSELLKEFQRNKVHMAIVVDEYGGTAGLVTLEDLLEEVVGEIFDEYDVRESLFVELDRRTILADAKLTLEDLGERLNKDMHREGCDTLGGLLFTLFDRVPEEGEKVEHDGMTFVVEEVEGQRIGKVRLILPEGLEEDES